MTYRYLLFAALVIFTCLNSCKKKEKTLPVVENPDPKDTSGNWQTAGDRILTNNGNARPFICVDKEGIPYIIYSDGLAGGKATVVKLLAGKWTVVGVNGFSQGRADNPVMTIDPASSLPYVTYVETSPAGINKVVVMKYNGSEWQAVGSTYFQANSVCTPTISVDNSGQPVIGYTAPPYVGIAKAFDGAGWNSIFTSTPERRVYKVDVSARHSYLSYLWDSTLGITHLNVLKHVGGNWNDLQFPSDISPTSYSFATDKAGVPYVAIEGKSPLRMLSVMKYEGSWDYVGGKDFTAGLAASPVISIGDDTAQTPYLTYRNGNEEPAVMFFSHASWNNVGTELPKDKITYSSLAVNPVDNTVYLAVNDKATGAISVLTYRKD